MQPKPPVPDYDEQDAKMTDKEKHEEFMHRVTGDSLTGGKVTKGPKKTKKTKTPPEK